MAHGAGFSADDSDQIVYARDLSVWRELPCQYLTDPKSVRLRIVFSKTVTRDA